MEIPKEVKSIIKKLIKNGYQAYIVGGCVRDLLMKKEPQDWDVATNALPLQISKIFPNNYIDNKFGTVKVQTKSRIEALKEIEITTFRIEESYVDKRHPNDLEWAKTIEEDLARRDFTVNAMAIKLDSKLCDIIDLFGGQKDLKDKTIRAVGEPDKRFKEDALRLMRAIRFACVLDFKIESRTYQGIKNNSGLLSFISKERIRDELVKIIMSKNPSFGIELLRETGLLRCIIPEILEGYKIGQNKHHIYDIYEHALKSLSFAASQNFDFHIRFAVLLHDVGKPRTKAGEGLNSTFYNHEVVGAKMTAQILERLKFPRKDIKKITKLVRFHLFYYNVGEVNESSVRRLLRGVGQENIKDLVYVRMADRIGSGCPKALPYKLRHFLYVAERVSQDPIDVTMLKVSGNDIMEILSIEPGPLVGKILNILLAEVLEMPSKNKKGYLKERIKELGGLDQKELDKAYLCSKEKTDEVVAKRDKMTKNKYWVT